MSNGSFKAIRQDLFYGNLWRVVPLLVFPLLTSGLLSMAWNYMNGYWVGRMGAIEFAAINISSFFIWVYFALLDIVRTGVTSLVARYDGADRKWNALTTAHQGVFFTFLISVLFSAIMLLFGSHFFRMMGAEESVVSEATLYVTIIFLYAPIVSFQDSLIAVMKGYGDTKTPMKALSMAFIIFLIIDPFLILGVGKMQGMGAPGGAIAMNLGFTVSTAYILSIILHKEHRFSFRKKFFTINFSTIADIVKIGLPLSINSLIFSIVGIFIGSMVAGFGTESVAALGIGHRVESLSFLFCSAFSTACITLVGQNLGAGLPERADRSAWIAMLYAFCFTCITSILFYTCSRGFAQFFISEPATISVASGYLKIISYSQIAMGLSLVMDGIFAGRGKTVAPMLITVPVVLARIPLGWFLAYKLSWGIVGIWWAITILTFAKAVFYFIWFVISRDFFLNMKVSASPA